MASTEPYIQLAVYIVGGVAYASTGYMAKVKKQQNVTFSNKKFFKTVLIGAVAGVIAVLMGDEMSDASIAAAMAIAIPIVDKAINAARSSTAV